MEDKYKQCAVCKDNKLILEFNKDASRKDGLQRFCKVCSSQNNKKNYLNNLENNKARLKSNKEKLKNKIKEYIVEVLKSGCIDCGEKDIIVLDFDHRGDKKYDIGNMLCSGRSLNNVKIEIAKCDIRCANCHRRKTAKQFNWWRYKLTNNIE